MESVVVNRLHGTGRPHWSVCIYSLRKEHRVYRIVKLYNLLSIICFTLTAVISIVSTLRNLTMASSKGDDTIVVGSPPDHDQHFHSEFNLKTAKRSGKSFNPEDGTAIFDGELSREAALTALTAEEEKRLLRKVDWRLIPLLCMLYLVKKLDESNVSSPQLQACSPPFSHAGQVSNARIMNKGTDRNILTQLGITSNQFGMVTVLYTVS